MTKRTYFVQLPGEIHCQTMHKLQDHFMNQIVGGINHPNIIYAFNFTPTLTFGSRENCNFFSSNFETELVKYVHSKGRQINSNEELYSKEIMSYLIENGVIGIDFMKSSRGGGATYLGPGQRTYFTNFNLKNGKNNLSLNKEFVQNIDKTMRETVSILLPQNSKLETRDKFDLTYIDDKGEHKLGSRGFSIKDYQTNGITKLMTKYGLSFHLTNEGLKHFEKVIPCGLSYNEANPISLEGILGKQISIEEFDRIFQHQFQQNFPFELEINPEFNRSVIGIYQSLLNQKN